MEPNALVVHVSVKILSSLARDLLKRSLGTGTTPIDRGIARTVEAFPEIEDLKTTLEQWLTSPKVSTILDQYVSGFKSLDDLRVDALAMTLVKDTQFYLPDRAEVVAQELVSVFLSNLRQEYLRIPEQALPCIANQLETLTASVEEVKTRFPVTLSADIGSNFDSEIDEARDHLQSYRRDLARHILDRLRHRSWDRLNSRQRFRVLTNLAAACLLEDQRTEAARLFIEAKEWQPDDAKALANEAWAYCLFGQTGRAFELSSRARERFPSSALALAVWLRAAPSSLTLKELEDAVPAHLAEEVDVVTALAERSLIAKDYRKAEALARSATKGKGSLSYPWALLGECLFRSELPDNPDDYIRLASLCDDSRLREAEEACSKAIELGKTEMRVSVEASALLVRAGVRRGLGEQVAGDEDIIAAWQLQPEGSSVLREYARLKLRRGETRDAVEMLRSGVKRDDCDDLRMLLAFALSSTGNQEDRDEATQICESVATHPAQGLEGYRMPAVIAALDNLARDQRWKQARALIARLPTGGTSTAARATLEGRLELSAGNRGPASELATKAIASISDTTSREELRQTAVLLADLGRHRDALPLWQRLASPSHLGHDTRRLIDCALRLGEHAVFLALCEQLRARGVFDKQLVISEAEIRAHYDIEGSIGLLKDYLIRSPEDRVVSLQLSAIGLELGRKDLVSSDPGSTPSPDEVPPQQWKLIVATMRSGGHLQEALRFAYRILRCNFGEPEAHRAYLAALMPTGPKPEIPDFDVAGPGTAVEFAEEGVVQLEWRVIEDEFDPDASLQEIGADHFIAQQLNGKHAGESFLVAQGSVASIRGTVKQIISKYVYRYQECLASWQKRFPGLPDIQSIRVTRYGSGDGPELDFAELFATFDRLTAHQQEAISLYRSQPVPVHLLAAALRGTEFAQRIGLAFEDSIPVRCCVGTADERASAILVLKNTSAIVIDLAAIATLALLDAFDELQRFQVEFLVSELTFVELRRALDEHTCEGGDMGSLRREGTRYVFESVTRESVISRREFLESVITKVGSHSRVIPCQELAAVPPAERDFLVKAIGEHGAQSVVLASAPGRVLWTDDEGVAMLARHKFGVRRVWTQVALQEKAEVGAITPEVFFNATARLIGWRYRFTSPSTPALVSAASLAEWNPGRQPLKQALELLSDKIISTKDAVALALSFIRHYAAEIVLPHARNSLTVNILENLARRGEGLAPVENLARALPNELGVNVLRARELSDVIRAWIFSKPLMELDRP